VTGALIVIGVFILLFKRIVLIDTETKKPIEFQFPILGKVKTQAPAVLFFLVGAGLVVLAVILEKRGFETHEVRGTIQGRIDQATVWVVALPHFQTTPDDSGQFKVFVPVIDERTTYQVKVVRNRRELVTTSVQDPRAKVWDVGLINVHNLQAADSQPTYAVEVSGDVR
jgi:hypothetical protein